MSILIPAYNAERYIAQSIQSALAQSWGRKEVIVVNDGSTDATPSIAHGFESPPLKVVDQENRGAAAARNAAFRECQGDFVQWLDADDLLSAQKIEHQVSALTRSGTDRTLASCPWGDFRNRPRKASFRPGPLWGDMSPTEWLLRKWESNSHMQTATWLVPRRLAEEAGPWDTRLLGDDDGEYFNRVLAISDGVRFVHRSRVYYRISPTTRLSYIGTSGKKLEAQFVGMCLQIERLRQISEGARTDAACKAYLDTWVPYFVGARPDLVEQFKALARSWGTELEEPSRPAKYRWIQYLFGWNTSVASQRLYNAYKSLALEAWDRSIAKWEGDLVDFGSL